MMPHISRRTLMQAMSALGFLAPVQAFAQTSPQTLRAIKASSFLLGPDNAPVSHLTFDVSPNGPVLRGTRGQEMRFVVSNTLDETLWLHLFGMRGPAEMMTISIAPKSDQEVSFTPPDAGTFWIGPLLAASRLRGLGLGAVIIIDDALEAPFHDVPVLIQDWSFDANGQIDQSFGDLKLAVAEGRVGNWFTVNGRYKPRLVLPTDKPARLRLLNAANALSTKLVFIGAEAVIIARDGHPVWPYPIATKDLILAPGQRVDVVLKQAESQFALAIDRGQDTVEAAFFDATNLVTIANPTPLAPNLPGQWPPGLIARSVTMAIEGGLKGGLQRAAVGKDILDLRAMLEQGLAWSIGGSAGLGSPAVFQATRGELLTITLDNRTQFDQPLHIHGHVWTTQNPSAANQEGPERPIEWSDTLVVPAQTQRQVYLLADNPGTWAIQSLIAERCDAGLIGSFVVADMP